MIKELENYATKKRPINDLIAAEYNPRKITEKEFSDLKDSLKRFGFVEPVLVNMHQDRENIIIGGHMRTRAAEALGYTEVPCIELSLTLEQEKELNIRLNKNGGKFDMDLLSIHFEVEDLLKYGFEEFEFDMGPVIEAEPAEEGEFDAEPPKEPITVLGDLYELNGHRLLCGDSTSVDDVERLMNGVIPDLIHTDPPYGMNAVSKPGVLKANYGQDIIGDDNPDIAKDAFRLVYSLYPDAKQIWWGANYYSSVLPDSECWLVWDKNNGESDQTDCELAWANFRSVVRQFTQASEKTNRVHPTQKPVSLVQWIMRRFNLTSKTIADYFGGSGVTMIAAEQMEKQSYLMEYDPRFMDVIVRRWVKYMQENNRPYTVKRNGELLSQEELAKF